MSLGLLVLLALATGVLTPVQSAANAKLAKEGIGSPVLAAAVNTAVGTLNLLLIAVALCFAGSLLSRPQGGWGQVPWWGRAASWGDFGATHISRLLESGWPPPLPLVGPMASDRGKPEGETTPVRFSDGNAP